MVTTKRAKQMTASDLGESYVYFCDSPGAKAQDAFRAFGLAKFETERPHEVLDSGDLQFMDGTKRYRVKFHTVGRVNGWAIFEVKQ